MLLCDFLPVCLGFFLSSFFPLFFPFGSVPQFWTLPMEHLFTLFISLGRSFSKFRRGF